MIRFLDKLKKEEKLELTQPSEQIANSYEKKSTDCIKASKILFNSNLYENAVGEAYFSMYNSVQSLFFKCGIKCESHSGSVILLEKLFRFDEIHKIFSEAKAERIDKQYFVTSKQDNPSTKESAKEFINIADRFNLELNAYKLNLKLSQIDEIRKRFDEL